MKVATTLLKAIAAAVLLSTNVSGQDLSGLPTCADSCVAQLLSSSGCGDLDYKCICSNSAFISNISCCIQPPTCSTSELASVISFADSLCAGFGVTNLPTAAVCSSTSSAASSSSTRSVSSSPTTSSTTTTATAQIPSCYNANPSATTPCVLTPTSTTAAAAAASSASSVSAAISSSLSSEVASASSAASSAAAAASSTAAAVSSSASAAAAAATTTAASASAAAATTTAAASTGVGNLNGVKGMGVAGAVVGAAAGVMGILL